MIGGWAFNLHARPRVTGDIDFFLEISDENQKAIRLVLINFGFESTLPSENIPILNPGKILMMGVEPTRIDILTELSGVTFKEVWDDRLEANFFGLIVPIISKELLIKNKKASARLKDLADIEQLEKI